MPRTISAARAEATSRGNPRRVKGGSSAAIMITSRKRSYRVRPHPRPVPSQAEVGETQVLGALLGVAEMAAGLTDMDELLAAIVRITPGPGRVGPRAGPAPDAGPPGV